MQLNQFADSYRIPLPVPMAGDGIGAAGRVNPDFRPKYARRNLHGSNLRYRNALIIAPEQTGFNAADTLRGDHDARRKYKIALRPPAGRKGFSRISRLA